MIAVRQDLIDPVDTLFQIQGGGLNDAPSGASNAWPIFAMTAGATPTNTYVLGWLFTERNSTVAGAHSIDLSSTGLNVVSELAYAQAAAPTGSIWCGIVDRFDAVSAAVAATADITRTPITNFRVDTTQYTRWEIT
jgi:hypothetical protein